MVTLVGTQDDFADAMIELLELEAGAAEAYKNAIESLENPEYRTTLQSFLQDHYRHIQEIKRLLKEHDEEVPDDLSSLKGLMAEGKVAISKLIGDKAILSAMHSNEEDTNTAYERLVNHSDKWEDADDFLTQAYHDEKRHKAWLESNT